MRALGTAAGIAWDINTPNEVFATPGAFFVTDSDTIAYLDVTASDVLLETAARPVGMPPQRGSSSPRGGGLRPGSGVVCRGRSPIR